MRTTRTAAITALSFVAIVSLLAGCQKEGPAERAGKEIDNTVKKLTQSIDLPAVRPDAMRIGAGDRSR
jgi:hypothetical protein